jgi:hypothetical protein
VPACLPACVEKKMVYKKTVAMVIVIFAILVTQVFGLDKPTCPADNPTCGQVKVDGEWLIGDFFHFLPPLFPLPLSVSFFVPLSLCPSFKLQRKANGAGTRSFSRFPPFSFSCRVFNYSFALEHAFLFLCSYMVFSKEGLDKLSNFFYIYLSRND